MHSLSSTHITILILHLSLIFISSTTSKKDEQDFKCFECSSIAHEGGTDSCRSPGELRKFTPLRLCNNWKDAVNRNIVEKMLERDPEKKFVSACHRSFFKSGNHVKVTRNCKAMPDINEKRNKCSSPTKDERELAKNDQQIDSFGWVAGVESMVEVCYCDTFSGCNYSDFYPPPNTTFGVGSKIEVWLNHKFIVGALMVVYLYVHF